MAKQPTAGSLSHRVAFDKRVEQTDAYGNTVADFEEQFTVAAEFWHRAANETVIAAALQGRQVLQVSVRSTMRTRQIQTGWRMRDVRTNVPYAIDGADVVTDRDWVRLTVEAGVAA